MPQPSPTLPPSSYRFSARPGLYAITGDVPGLLLEDVALALLHGGAPVVQLRAKRNCTTQHLTEAARTLMPKCETADALLIINDDVEAARASQAHGVHLGQRDLDPRIARDILGPDAILGYSTHHIGQVEQAIRWHDEAGGQLFSYLAFGPLFPTATKQDADPVTGTQVLREVRTLWLGPLVGIGGITADRLPVLAAAGLTRPALISALMAPTIERIVVTTAALQHAWLHAVEANVEAVLSD